MSPTKLVIAANASHAFSMSFIENFTGFDEGWAEHIALEKKKRARAEANAEKLENEIGEVEEKIGQITYLTHKHPNPNGDELMFDWIAELTVYQKSLEARLSVEKKLINVINEYISALRTDVN